MAVKYFVACVLGAIAAGGAVSADAADLFRFSGGQCINYRQSLMPLMPVSDMRAALAANLASARAGMSDPVVVASRQPAYLWAMEARWSCAAALGYLAGGTLDEETVQKCDCYHQQYVSFR